MTLNYSQLAHRDEIERLLQAFIREKLLDFSYKENTLLICLKKTNLNLLIENVEALPLARYKIKGMIKVVDQENNCIKIIEDAEDLLKICMDEIIHKFWGQILSEVKESINNATLSLRFCESWKEQITSDGKKLGYDALWKWARDGHAGIEPGLFFEQWASQGHPTHPCNKTKWGFSEKDVLSYAPEFRPIVNIQLAAIHKEHVQIELQSHIQEYVPWFKKNYPSWAQKWFDKMKLHDLPLEEFVPIPIHPWQQEHIIPQNFSELITAGKLYLFTDVSEPATPTLSFHTLETLTQKKVPHIKLPVAVRAINYVRDIKPREIRTAPKVSQLVAQLVSNQADPDYPLRVLHEPVGLHVLGFVDDIANNLAVLFRENPNILVREDELAIVVAALFSHSPITNKPLGIELMETAGVKNVQEALDYFHHYAELVLSAFLDMYLLYGIGIEGHQQNSIAVFKEGKLHAIIERDYGAVRMQADRLKERGIELTLPTCAKIFFAGQDEIRNRLLHAVYQMHFGSWTHQLAQYYSVSENLFWQIIRAATENRFIFLKDKMDPKIWQQEYEAILEADWPLEAFLSKRLSDFPTVMFTSIKNPLVKEG